ncbi:hypothetical protein [Capnocytophaga catalasegens]|nr:hypothetical protein [Capnocytophaga catalasegens]
MKKKIFELGLFLSPLMVFAQSKYGIELPAGGRVYEGIEHLIPVDVYITKEQGVFDDAGRQFVYFDDISNYYLNKQKAPHDILLPRIFADKNTRFSFIQKVTKQFASVWGMKVDYMTQLSKGEKGSLCLIISTSYVKDRDEISTLEQDIADEKFNEEINKKGFSSSHMEGQDVTEDADEELDFSFSPPPPMPWYLQLRLGMYSQNVEEVKKILEENKYAVVYFLPNKQIEFQNQIINDNKLTNLLKENQVLFLRFNREILYGDYIHSIERVHNIVNKLQENRKLAAYPIEVFSDLEDFLQENNIQL